MWRQTPHKAVLELIFVGMEKAHSLPTRFASLEKKMGSRICETGEVCRWEPTL
jgi:hypothetical protein